MIITRTPTRLSLCGGGSDYPVWFEKYGGVVVGGSINKYSYITARTLPPFHDHKTRLVYSEIETVNTHSDIKHRAIRASLEYLQMQDNSGLEIFHSADMPGRSGTGSSSAFVVGLINALAALRGELLPKRSLMQAAIHIEQKLLNDSVGCQDQAFAAFGGLRVIRFKQNHDISVLPLVLSQAAIDDLQAHLLLMFTRISRTASDIARTYVPTLCDKTQEQWAMIRLAELGIEALYSGDWEKLGKLIDQSWRIKASLSPQVSLPQINEAYIKACICGAWGGKLTGAGGGGCMLLVAPPEKHQAIIKALPEFVHVPFRFDDEGSVVVFTDGETNGR